MHLGEAALTEIAGQIVRYAGPSGSNRENSGVGKREIRKKK